MIISTGSFPAGLSSNNIREVLERRAALLGAIRQYFAGQSVLEVETPLLREFGVTDPQLENIRAEKTFVDNEWLYLQTSPEYAMKQLIAKGSGCIYQICKAFRRDPIGKLHNIEFTMLEWYRMDFSLEQLIDDVFALVNHVGINREKEVVTYQQLFREYLSVDPLNTSLEELRELAKQKIDIDADDEDIDFWLDLLLTHCIEPKLGRNKLTFVTDYPASQAALAKLKKNEAGGWVAERFELYIEGVEIANGYHELTAASDYHDRFVEDNSRRLEAGLETAAIDEEFLQAISNGLPASSGVAMGLDRLCLFLMR